MNATTHRTPGETFAGYTQLEVMVCPMCGICYAIPKRLVDDARRYGNWKQMWYCPLGHHLGFGKNEIQKLERQRAAAEERATAERAFREQAEASARAQRAAATRARRERDKDRHRVAHGVCPCCKRTFKQLAAHIERKHPEYAEQP